jgi:hypothetical protein
LRSRAGAPHVPHGSCLHLVECCDIHAIDPALPMRRVVPGAVESGTYCAVATARVIGGGSDCIASRPRDTRSTWNRRTHCRGHRSTPTGERGPPSSPAPRRHGSRCHKRLDRGWSQTRLAHELLQSGLRPAPTCGRRFAPSSAWPIGGERCLETGSGAGSGCIAWCCVARLLIRLGSALGAWSR